MRLLMLLVLLACAAAEPAVAGPMDDAISAYLNGDVATARSLLRPLAEKGDAEAQYNLCMMLAESQDEQMAASWCRKAADQKHAYAQYMLGLWYSLGRGVPKDYTIAVSWYRKAAEQGNANAETNLGVMYQYGYGVPQDARIAVSWFRKAAEQGDANAENNLGVMYQYGQGVPKDNVLAYMWLNLAASHLDANERDKAVKNRDAVAANMTPAQIAEAQKNLRERLAKVPNPASADRTSGSSIQMKKDGGTYVVPVLINSAITLDFMVDSGASDVSIPEDVVTTLMRTGTIRDTDFIGEKTYILADGSRVSSRTFRIRSLKVGDRVLENVMGSVASTKGNLLLGQSFLGRFTSWSIDNTKHVLVLE
jgi:clan AA aspartic protease (TIGR02281 family)